jgi:AcrR family transcriptional regulator
MTNAEHSYPTPSDPDSDFSSDGRHRRRQRNTEAVRRTVLAMLSAGEVITVDALAAQSGVAVRTIYRHFGGPAGAIDDAVRSRLDEVTARLAGPAESGALDERIARVIQERLDCLEMMLPVLAQSGPRGAEVVDETLTADIEQRFGGELGEMSDVERKRALALLTLSLRFTSLEYLLLASAADTTEVAVILDAQLRRYLRPFASTG